MHAYCVTMWHTNKCMAMYMYICVMQKLILSLPSHITSVAWLLIWYCQPAERVCSFSSVEPSSFILLMTRYCFSSLPVKGSSLRCLISCENSLLPPWWERLHVAFWGYTLAKIAEHNMHAAVIKTFWLNPGHVHLLIHEVDKNTCPHWSSMQEY